MAILKPRTKIVTFRVAEEEFEYLKNLSIAEGARSLSDYTRAAVCNVASRPPRDVELYARVRKLDGKVEEIERAVKELVQLIGNGYRSPGADA